MESTLDDFSCVFHGTSRFGRYPTPPEARLLEEAGTTVFVDLTEPSEGLPPYPLTRARRVHHPIEDRRAPRSVAEYLPSLAELVDALADGEVLYIHCRGGHGRSGLVVATILALLALADDPSSPETATSTALALTRECHSRRRVMDPRWRRLGAPQTRRQKAFVGEVARAVSSGW